MRSADQPMGSHTMKPSIAARLKRVFFPPRIDNHRFYRSCLKGKKGLELGGPSKIFSKRGLIPVYPVIERLDGCNFSSETVWEGRIREGSGRYRYAKGRRPGRQFISDAVMLTGIEDRSYDFILSSHCLEHIANPLGALNEWLRVLKPGGHLILVLPDKEGTFDHRRPVTTLAHLIEDLERSTGEADLTHLSEILDLHDLARDPQAGDPEQFRQRSLKNAENRCLHQHVFDTDLVARLIDHVELQLLDLQQVMPYHVIVIARKPGEQNYPG